MPYRYTTFNGIKLPDRMTEDDLGAPPANGTIVDSLAGGFNYLGNNRYYPKRHPIRYRGMYTASTIYLVDEAGNYIVDEAGNFIIVAEADAYLRGAVDDIKAQHGKWAQLVRRREEDGAEHFKYARLLDIQHQRTLADTDRVARLDLQFEAEGKPWRSVYDSVVYAVLSATAWNNIDITPAGPEDIRDARLIITATASLTSFVIGRTGALTYYLFYTGALVSGDTVIIDCGAQTVTKNGVDNYAEFLLGPGIHTAPDWLLIPGGVTSDLLVYPNGGSATITISYYDQWA